MFRLMSLVHNQARVTKLANRDIVLKRFTDDQKLLACWLALHRTPGVGPITFMRLLAQFPNLQLLFENPKLAKNISERSYQALLAPNWDLVEQDLLWFEEPNRHIVTIQDERYPHLLKEIVDSPSILFVEGDASLLSEWQLGIIGSRNPSVTGRDNAFEFSRYLAHGGLIITSGLSEGIDAAAHQGALAVKGKTLSVIGSGLDCIYPEKQRELARDIVQEGALVSEFALGTSPRPENFPRRNRLISGLSLGVLVVEASSRSRSLGTARMALEQGREVFSIPGSIHNPLAKGCHQLIREGAKLVETAEDIIEELGALASAGEVLEKKEAMVNSGPRTLDGDYQLLFTCLGYDPVGIDTLAEQSGLTVDIVSSMLLLLELEGRVASLSGGRYTRVNGSGIK